MPTDPEHSEALAHIQRLKAMLAELQQLAESLGSPARVAILDQAHAAESELDGLLKVFRQVE